MAKMIGFNIAIIILTILLIDLVQGQFHQNGPNHDALYNNYFNNQYSYNNIGRGYISNDHNYIGENNQSNYLLPPRNIGGDFVGYQNHQFNQGNKFNDGFHGISSNGRQGNLHAQQGGGQVMAWDLRGQNTASWGKFQWDTWFDELEVKLGFRQRGPKSSGGNVGYNLSSQGPLNYDMNLPEWQNDASFENESRSNRRFFQKTTATYTKKNLEGLEQKADIPMIEDLGFKQRIFPKKGKKDDDFEANMNNGFDLLDRNGNKWPEMKGRLSNEEEFEEKLVEEKKDEDFGVLNKSYYLRRKSKTDGKKKTDNLQKHDVET